MDSALHRLVTSFLHPIALGPSRPGVAWWCPRVYPTAVTLVGGTNRGGMPQEAATVTGASCLDLVSAVHEASRLRSAPGKPLGWSSRIRRSFGYFTPDEWYEATLLRLVGSTTDWLDVGCGHQLVPSNFPLALLLASRARSVVGVDPSDNIERNELVHERARCRIEEYTPNRTFDLISLRMVAEHITDPRSAVAALSRLTRDGGRVVVYTVSRWSPASMLAAVTPMAVHHFAKSVVWPATRREDTFRTVYRMNTRTELSGLFAQVGLTEESFLYLDDCRILGHWQLTTKLELWAQRMLRSIGLPYLDVCLLGVYRKIGSGDSESPPDPREDNLRAHGPLPRFGGAYWARPLRRSS